MGMIHFCIQVASVSALYPWRLAFWLHTLVVGADMHIYARLHILEFLGAWYHSMIRRRVSNGDTPARCFLVP